MAQLCFWLKSATVTPFQRMFEKRMPTKRVTVADFKHSWTIFLRKRVRSGRYAPNPTILFDFSSKTDELTLLLKL